MLSILKSIFGRRVPLAQLKALALRHYERGELQQAEQYFLQVAHRSPDDLSAWTNLAATLMNQQKHGSALPVLERIVDIAPDLAPAHLDLGTCYNRLRQNRLAVDHYHRALELDPELHKAHANVINAYLDLCDWRAVDQWATRFRQYRDTHPRELWAQRLQPFCSLTLFPGEIAKELAIHRASEVASAVSAASEGARVVTPHPKIRIGYASSDFYSHATAHLTYGLYAAHDRREFEVFAYSFGPDDGSVYRRHIEETCDRFVDVRHETAARTGDRIRSDGIDILVDMKGYTADSRPEIFAARPAPVQVSYLGYPGTTGADYMDYFISDRVATPPGYEDEFTERIVRLPDSYQVNDNQQAISSEPVTRADFRLPENGMVYCCFNRPRKIDRTVFDAWMAILRQVPHSVLWLLQEDSDAATTLKSEAAARGISPERLIFSPPADKPRHLSRLRLADLMLDTFDCNAHTGTSDALWAGLPVLTRPGATFIARVAASLVSAADLPELIARDVREYEASAVRLGRNPAELAALRQKLSGNRPTCALFDTPRYVRNLEAAFRRMHEISRSGQPPTGFAV